MTRRNPILVLLFVTMGLLLGACRDATVYNVQDSQLAGRNESVTLDQVADAIVRAGAGLNWTMVEEAPGHMVGTLNLREHRAVADIYFTSDSFSITYKDSANLLYTGSTIHRNYNLWIRNLERAIQVEVASL